MFWLIKQEFIVLLSFSKSLATKCASLNNEPCMSIPNVINLNLVEPNYCPFMIRQNTCNRICNAADDLSTKVCVPSKTKDVNVKVFNMIKRINEAKTLVKPISYECKCKFSSITCNSNQ